ncbi:hypothetical protein [Thiomonas sp.]
MPRRLFRFLLLVALLPLAGCASYLSSLQTPYGYAPGYGYQGYGDDGPASYPYAPEGPPPVVVYGTPAPAYGPPPPPPDSGPQPGNGPGPGSRPAGPVPGMGQPHLMGGPLFR